MPWGEAPETSLLQILFPAGENVNWDGDPSEFIDSQSSRRAGLAPRNRPVAGGRWGMGSRDQPPGTWGGVGPRPTTGGGGGA